MSEEQYNPRNESWKREKLLVLFKTRGLTDEYINPDAPENLDSIQWIFPAFPVLKDHEAAKDYLNLARSIGPSPSENPKIVELIQSLKEQFKNRPEVLRLIQKYSGIAWLNDSEITDMGFFDSLDATLPAIIARVYLPERFKYLTEGLIETEDISVDEIYSSYVKFLKRNIDFGKSKGYPEEGSNSADSLSTYIPLYKRLTT